MAIPHSEVGRTDGKKRQTYSHHQVPRAPVPVTPYRGGKLVSKLVGALSPVNHKRITSGADHKLKPISKSFISQVIIPQVFLSQTTAQILFTISERKTRKTIAHALEPIYIPRALNTGTCIQQGDLFYSADLHRNQC